MRVRRHGMCAALALVCMLYASAAWGVYDREFVNQNDFSAGVGEGLKFTSEMGGITLSHSTNCYPFVWAPSPRDNAVSKIDARSGAEIARYRIGPPNENWTPCAVTSDADGNAFVACASPGSVGRVVIILSKGSFDRNSDGAVSTSGDYDGNGAITPTEILSWGGDERVGVVGTVGVTGSSPSALVCDDRGHLWVALYEECKIARVQIATGTTVAVVPVVGKPGALLVGRGSSLWVLSQENRVLSEVSTLTNTLETYYNLDDCLPGGMCMDSNGKLWIGNGFGGVMALDTLNESWTRYSDGPGIASVTLDAGGDIWGACPASDALVRFSQHDGTVLSQTPLGKHPSAISTDADGYVWALCDRNDCAVRIDTRSAKQVAEVRTCGAPFSSTPFVSKITENGFIPSGYWRTVLDSRLDGAGWGRISWSSMETGGTIKFEARSADTADGLMTAAFQPVANGHRFNAPNGRYLELKVTLEGRGNTTPALYAMRVEGTNLPPDVSRAVPTVPRIGRLDHVMESVSVIGVKDPEGDEFDIEITKVIQDEPVYGLCEGDKSPDAMINGSSVWLRGECDPGSEDNPGNGRVYTVTFRATDKLGASSTGKVKVTVAPTIKPSDVALEDKTNYDSTRDVLKNVAKAE